MKKFYAVKAGRKTGIFVTWSECETQVKGFAGAKFKGFADKNEAELWLAGRAAEAEKKAPPDAADDEDFDYVIYTDGSCLKNPGGAGGWAAIITESQTDAKKELSGGEANTTNNRMELSAAINALAATDEGAKIALFTDSQYLKNAFTQNWLKNWQRNGWKTATGEDVKNKDLWLRLTELFDRRKIKFRWVKGHAGNEYNERCDVLAKNEAAKYQ